MPKEDDALWANELLLDHVIVDRDGEPVGMVDDLELTDPGDREGPVLTAILCGPTAFGPRIGGHIGVWWTAIGRRLRPADEPNPPRIAMSDVAKIDMRAIQLRLAREDVPTGALREWVLDKIIKKIPGSGA
jgi:hypothetical protein